MIEDLLELYPRYHYIVASSQLVLAILGMGAVLKLQDFVEIVLEPKPILVGALYQLIVIPLIALAITLIFHLPPEIAVGFFILAAMPGGAISNIYTHLGRGNVALSVALTALMTLAALITAPLILRFFAAEFLPPEIPMPAGLIVREIALFLLLPLSVGMLIGRYSSQAKVFSTWAIRASLLMIGILVAGSLGSGKLELESYGFLIPFLIVAFCWLIQFVMMMAARHILKFSPKDVTALAVESSMKNINLGVLISASLFGLDGPDAEFGIGVLFVLLLYGGASMAVCFGPVLRARRRQKKSA